MPNLADEYGFPTLTMHSEGTPYREPDYIPIEPETPVLNAEDFPEQYRQQTKSTLGDLGKVYDYAVQAPVRNAVGEYQKSREAGDLLPELRGLWGAAKSYFQKPEMAPTWENIAQHEGFSPLSFRDAAMQAGLDYDSYPNISPADIGGFVGENMLDPANLIGGGAGSAGLMAGKKAKNFPRAKGKMSGIWDKMQRFEIDDSAAKIKGYNLPRGEDYKMLNEVIDHPELFKNYPELKNVSISFDGEGKNAAFHAGGDGHITMGAELLHDRKQLKETLLHEIQHNLQEIEGFAKGGSPDDFAKRKFTYQDRNRIDEALQIIDFAERNNLPMEGIYSKLPKQLQDFNTDSFGLAYRGKDEVRKLSDEAHPLYGFNKYQRLAGEAEARDASARMGMTAEQRLSQQPLESTGLNLSDLIVRGESKGPQ